MQHRVTSALLSLKGGKEKVPRVAAEVKKERRKKPVEVSGAWCFCKSRSGQARFEWPKVRRRIVSFHSMIAGHPLK